MSRSLTEINLHFVWTTKKREAALTAQWEPLVYRCVQNECRRLGAAVLALGGLEDHVHLLAVVPGHVSGSKLMQQVKGVSARFANGRKATVRSVSAALILSVSSNMSCVKSSITRTTASGQAGSKI